MRNKRTIVSWALYDFANSAFAATILAVIFNVYFVKVIIGEKGIGITGIKIPAEALWGYLISISMLIVFAISPVLGAIADLSGSKKKFLFWFWLLGWISTGLMFFLGKGDIKSAIFLFICANTGFAGANALYNAFLPYITDTREISRISGFGWALGYIGGGICLILNLLLIQHPNYFGIKNENFLPQRISLLIAGIWWAIFAIPLFVIIKEHKVSTSHRLIFYIAEGFRRIKFTLSSLGQYKELLKFFIGFLIYNEGIQTVIIMASIIGVQELGFSQGNIIKCFLLIQGMGFVGALFFGVLGDKIGNKKTILITLVVWVGVVGWGFYMRSQTEFWIAGALIGFVMGGTQSASRALFALMSPPERSGEFFGFFGIAGKFASMLGPFLFGLIQNITGSLRAGIFSILVFFIIGFIVLLSVRISKNP